MDKKAASTKKTTSTVKAVKPSASKPAAKASTAPKTTTTTKAPSASSSAVPTTPKAPPVTPKPSAATVTTSKPSSSSSSSAVPLTPKTPKPAAVPLTPKTPKGPASKPAAASSRPTTAKSTTAAKPASTAAKKPATASTTAKPAASKPTTTTKTTTTGASRPVSAKPTSSSTATKPTRPATAHPTTSSHSTTAQATTSSHPTTAHVTNGHVSDSNHAGGGGVPAISPRAPGNKTPRGTADAHAKPATASGIPRPSTTGAKASAAKPAAATGLKRPASGVNSKPGMKPLDTAAANAAAKGVKPPTPRDSGLSKVPSGGLPKVSPRKSPRHNAASISRTQTAPELPVFEQRPGAIVSGSRSVSVGGLQSNMTRAAPAGRRKPTTNPLKNRPSTAPTQSTQSGGRAAAGMLSGLGLLASVDGDFSSVQLRKVSEEKPKVLLIHVKGRRNVTARAVETTCRSLNKGDAFVLCDPSTRRIFEWRGAEANKMEIAKAMDIAGRMKNKEFGGRADIFVLEDGKTDSNPAFWELLGGKGQIAPANSCAEDEDEDKQVRSDFIFGVVEKTQGKPELVEVGKHKLYKEMLQAGQIYLVDCLTELYMWVGKGCSNLHRTFISTKAQEVLTRVKARPKWVSIVRVIDGAEPEIFKEKFCDWPSTLPITMASIAKGNVAGTKASVKFDVNKLFAAAKRDDRVFDDGNGKIEIWRVKDHTKEAVTRDMYGQFFDSESYVILYTYIAKNREQYVIYFWQGKKSSINEKGSSALLTVDLDDSIGGAAVQIRVVQNKEPKHFMKLFKGRIIVHKALETEDGASAIPETALYQVRGFNMVDAGCDVRAIQLPSPSAKYLNTNNVFLLNTPEKQYIWKGTTSSKFYQISEQTLMELGASTKGAREQIFINEGAEPNDFWENVGAAEYYRKEWHWLPRLFHCSSASGTFLVEEVLEFDQEDLDVGHLNILDTSVDVFLWTGQRASIEEEKKQAMELVLEYTKGHPTRKERGMVSDILSVTGRREPAEFRSIFTAWDDTKSLDANGLNDSLKVEDMLKELSRTYTLAELRNPPKMLDSTKLETYLSEEEFQVVLKMDKPTFFAQPLWKQEQQKKNVGLY